MRASAAARSRGSAIRAHECVAMVSTNPSIVVGTGLANRRVSDAPNAGSLGWAAAVVVPIGFGASRRSACW